MSRNINSTVEKNILQGTAQQKSGAFVYLKRNLQRIVLGFFAAAIISSGALMPLASAGAITKTSALTPDQMAESFGYYKALRVCMINGWYENSNALIGAKFNSLQQSYADEYKWFDGQKVLIGPPPITNNVNVGAHNDPRGVNGDGSQNCGDSEGWAWIGKAVQLWGYSSGVDFLCKIGFDRGREDKSIPCTEVTPGANADFIATSSVVSNFDNLWTSSAGFGNSGVNPGNIGPGEYKLYLNNLKSQCRLSDSGTAYTIQEFSGTDKSPKPAKYGAGSNDRGPGYPVTIYDGTTKTCQELVNLIDSPDDRAVLAYTTWLKTNELGDDGASTSTDCDASDTDCVEQTSCAIDGIGWIVCGFMRAMASVNDAMYGLTEGILLTAPLKMFNEDGTATPQYQVWQGIRDIANVLLVIAFLIIIFSQATSIGISNYGIKKMLPRIVLSAIAINLSFFIMMISVDLANLLGVGLHSFVGGIADDAFNAANLNWTDTVEGFLTGAFVAGAGTAAVGLGALLGGFNATALGLLALPFIVVAILALLAAFITLFLRNAFIIVLVIISPLAFAAYLLPNTESLFTKWRKAFIALLMLFPTAALLFAGAKLAAYVVMAADNGGIEQLFALFIMAAPLFMLPWLARSGGGLLSTVGDRLQKLAQSAKSPLQKGLNPLVQNQRADYRAGNRGWIGRRYQDPQARAATGQRNLAQRGYDKTKNLENDTKEAEHEAEERHYERGLHGGTRDAIRTRTIRDRSGQNKDRTEAIDKQYDARTNQWRTQTAEGQAVRDTIADATNVSEMFQKQQQLRQDRRINNNVRSTVAGTVGGPTTLGQISRQQFAATEASKDVQMKIDRTNKESGVANASIAGQKRTQEFLDKFDADRKLDHSVVMNNDAEMIELSKQKSFTDKNIADQEGQLKLRNNRRARMSSTMRAVEARTKDNEYADSVLENRKNMEAEERLTTDPLMAQLRRGKEADDAKKERLQSQQQRDLQDRKSAGGSLFEEDALKRANEAEQAAAKKEQDQLFTEATTDVDATPGSDLQKLQNVQPGLRDRLQRADERTDVATSATARAENLGSQENAEKILADQAFAQKNAGVDPAGVAIAQARAAETQRKATEESISAYTILQERERTPSADPALGGADGPTDKSMLGIMQNSSLPIEARLAATRGVRTSGNIDASAPMYNHIVNGLVAARQKVATSAPGTPAREAAERELDEMQQIAREFASVDGSAKSFSWGAAEIESMKNGEIEPAEMPDKVAADPAKASTFAALNPVQKQTVKHLYGKGITADKVPGIDKSEIARIMDAADQGVLTPEVALATWQQLDESLSNPNYYNKIQPRETGYVLRAMRQLEASMGGAPTRKPRYSEGGVVGPAIQLTDLPPDLQ